MLRLSPMGPGFFIFFQNPVLEYEDVGAESVARSALYDVDEDLKYRIEQDDKEVIELVKVVMQSGILDA